MARWHGTRVLDIFTAASAGKTDNNSRKSFIQQALDQLDSILYMASPFSAVHKEQEKQRALSMEEKMNFLNKVNSMEDKSMDGLLGAITNVAGTLVKAD